MSDKLIVDDDEWDADDCRNMKRTADQMTIWKREGDKRIEELEVAVRRGIACIEGLVPYVMWDGLDGESDEAKVQTTLDLMRETVTR